MLGWATRAFVFLFGLGAEGHSLGTEVTRSTPVDPGQVIVRFSASCARV